MTIDWIIIAQFCVTVIWSFIKQCLYARCKRWTSTYAIDEIIVHERICDPKYEKLIASNAATESGTKFLTSMI